MYYFFMFGIFFFQTLILMLAWLGWIFLHPAKQLLVLNLGAKIPLSVLMQPRRSSKLSVTPTFSGKQPNFPSPPWKATLRHPKSKKERYFELRNSRMQLWVYFSIISMSLGEDASQVSLTPVAKGIFGAGGNRGAGIWGWDLCGTGS